MARNYGDYVKKKCEIVQKSMFKGLLEIDLCFYCCFYVHLKTINL